MQSASNVTAPSAFASRPVPHQPALRWSQPASERTYDFCRVARKLGLVELAPRTIVSTIRQLVDGHGFPAPLTVRLRAGQRLVGGQAVTAKSSWSADLVDAWLDRDLPPAAALSRDEAQRAQARNATAAGARLLVAANG